MAKSVTEQVRNGTEVDGVDVVGALSPSRAGDFKTCPLMYRYRTIDRLPEPPSPDAVRGTVVHKVLEDLFDLPAAERTPDRAEAMIDGAWEYVLGDDERAEELFAPDSDPAAQASWLDSCRTVLRKYFDLEDPTVLEPAERELYVETLLESKLLLRGFVDRVDVAPTGAIRVVDYKTGRSPGESFEAKALFQMRFYALVIWKTRGVIPAMLRLIYLGNGEMVSYSPDEQDLRSTERQLDALWKAISRAHESGDWRPNKSRLCDWCSFKEHCPEFGGTLLPLPVVSTGSTSEDASEAGEVEPGE
ncbi:RecB family exonuclease [Nocardioides marmorisolisilvae]|uniref:RecB family exonuclease n=1 Tax=Nocardioides marmorisolisilvae TaxID=1542737 RepID=A0A3N0DUY3_9ACTN|nr:RecB family exonuclease [Nocardioides marmorisolisilvae]RNL79361.1 RecB family exonuclease [Nocardioides marmorisolisilvae]